MDLKYEPLFCRWFIPGPQKVCKTTAQSHHKLQMAKEATILHTVGVQALGVIRILNEGKPGPRGLGRGPLERAGGRSFGAGARAKFRRAVPKAVVSIIDALSNLFVCQSIDLSIYLIYIYIYAYACMPAKCGYDINLSIDIYIYIYMHVSCRYPRPS